MSDKEMALQTVRGLPDSSSLTEISEELALLAALREAEAAADAGRVTPHEEVPALLATWLKNPLPSK